MRPGQEGRVIVKRLPHSQFNIQHSAFPPAAYQDEQAEAAELRGGVGSGMATMTAFRLPRVK